MIRLILADDEPNVRRALKMRLELEPDLAVAGEARDGLMAVAMCEGVQPDVVVMDVSMPCLDGIEAAARIRTVAPATRVVVLTLHDDPATRLRAATAGTAGFVCKHDPPEILIDAIRQAAQPE
jgi:DNA-binding NarL/FixJ family response regulator